MPQAISAPGTLDGCPEMTRPCLGINNCTCNALHGALLSEQIAWPSTLVVAVMFQAAEKQPPLPFSRRDHAPIDAQKGEPVQRCGDGQTFRVYGSPLHGGSLRETASNHPGKAFPVYRCSLPGTLSNSAGLVPGAIPATVPTFRNDLAHAPLRGATHLSYLTYRC